MVVQADAEDTVAHLAGDVDVRICEVGCTRRRIEICDATEIEVEVFELRRPVAAQCALDTTADNPTRFLIGE